MRTGMMKPIFVLLTSMCLSLSIGCGDDDATGDNNNNPVPDAAVDAAPDAEVGESLTVLVSLLSPADATYIPTQGITVAFDAPGGERMEADSDAEGKVTFTGIDWSLGTASVTAFRFAHTMKSIVHLDQAYLATIANEDGELQLGLEPAYPNIDTVVLSGTAAGLVSTNHNYKVNAVNQPDADDEWTGSGNSEYSIDVPSGEPFIVQAWEEDYTELPSGQGYDRPIYAAMHMDHDPITADTSGVELDFATYGMTTHTASVSFLMPTQADSPLRDGDIPYCFTCATNSQFCHGWPTYVDVVDNQNRVDVDFLWVEPSWPEDIFYFCFVNGSNNAAAQTVVWGYPQEGAQDTLMEPPRWITPTDPTVAHPIYDPMEVQYFEDTTESMVVIRRGLVSMWIVFGPPNTTTFTVPQAPTGVDLAQVLGSSPLVWAAGGTTTDDFRWLRYGRTTTARLALP